MDKKDFSVRLITKSDCAEILNDYHYLTGISKGFKSGVNFGLIYKNNIVGVCIFTGFPVPELVKGAFGLDRSDQDGFYELSRLCLKPNFQFKGGNISSFFVSRCLKIIKKKYNARAILSYADSGYHKGIIYQACNFKYYGLTDSKKDFWILQKDGSYIKHSRGKTKGIAGEWRSRTRKHRYLIIFDKFLNVKWQQQEYPK